MLPILHIGPWELRTYILVYTLAVLVAGGVMVARLRRAGFPHLTALRITLATTAAGFAGAYLIRVFPTLQRFLATGVWRWYGGNSFIGGLVSGIGVGALLCRLHRLSLPRGLDAALPAVALGQAIGRLGCFAAGCCYGRVTTSWLGVYLPDHDGVWAVRYPTQLLSAAANLLIFGLLLAVERRRARAGDGVLAALYLGLYCLERFINEALRADTIPLVRAAGYTLSWGQLYTLVGMGLALGWLVWHSARSGAARA